MRSRSLHTRRDLVVAGGTLAAGLALTTPAHARLLPTTRGVGRGLFLDGVASGEPGPNAVTFWGRMTTEAPRSAARLVVARDAGLRQVVATSVVPTSSGVDHTLKARIGGLAPSTHYWYAWQTTDDVSDVGRTKTAPPANSDTPVAIGYSSCQNYPAGFFNAHGDAAAHDLDVYAFLGDYTYEYGYGEYGGKLRGPDAKDPPSTDLTSYRGKLRLYRQDAGLRELHRMHPVVHVWDDHEVADNYTDGEPAPSDLQRNAGYRASFEWLPRLAVPGDRFRLYRSLRYGRNAELFMLDERQYRTPGEPGSTFLGRPQMDWLKQGLATSSASFKLVGNPDMIAPLGFSPVGSDGAVTVNPDQWDGYPAERDELLGHIAGRNIQDVVFLTGDIHLYMANDLTFKGAPVATEYIGGSVTSPGLPEALNGVSVVGLKALNPGIKFFANAEHGWAIARASSRDLKVEFRSNDITRNGASSVSLATFTQARGQNVVHQDGGIAASLQLPEILGIDPANRAAPPRSALGRRRARIAKVADRDADRVDRRRARASRRRASGRKGGR